MKATRWMLAGLLLLGALAVPCQAILRTCDDLCDCTVPCTLNCKNSLGVQTTCNAYGVCIGKPGCPDLAASIAPVSTPQICTANATATQPAFLATAPAQP